MMDGTLPARASSNRMSGASFHGRKPERRRLSRGEPMDLRDPDTFRGIYDENARSLYNLAFRLVGDRGRAEEIVQETFLRAYDRAETFRQGARVGTWLYRITTNLAYDYLRAKRYRDAVSLETRVGGDDGDAAQLSDRLPAPVEAPPDEADRHEVEDAVKELLDSLPDRERTVLVLRHFQGLTFERIAENLGLTSRTVQNCLRRARTKMFYGLRRRGITARDTE